MSKPSTKGGRVEAEADVFREAVKDAIPLTDKGRVVHPAPRPPPVPAQRLADDRKVLQDSLSDAPALELDLEAGDTPTYLRPGMSPQVLRKLRSGVWAVQDQLDLHGLRSEEARALLADFLNAAHRRGLRCVRVIHGKGWGSKNREPVLKRKVAGWLAQRGQVLAYCEARPAEGGGGAVVVLLQAGGERRGARGETQDE
jgi:DNA-nicking Smr family endonuclease